MPSSADIAAQIKATLALSEPDLDTTIGSVVGKIIDAVSLPVAEAFLDQHLTSYQYDIDSMTAGTLEGFVRLFGMDRRQARYAIGTVTFGRAVSNAAKTSAAIPLGTQVRAATNPVIYVRTLASAVMAVGQTTLDVPVQALTPGAAGNVAAGTLTLLVSEGGGVSTVTTNTASMTSGRDAESDTVLRERWKTTVLRNLAGTGQMYQAMGFQSDDAVTAVNVIGSRKTWQDRVTISGGVSPELHYGNPEFIYSGSFFLGPDLGSSVLLATKTDYTVTINNAVTPATLVINAVIGGLLADGDYDIQYDYVPAYSRNNPFGTRFGETAFINNRVDVWLAGTHPVLVTQACKFSAGAATRFGNASTDLFYRLNYSTLNGLNPTANDVFTPLAYGPVLSVPTSMTIGGSTFTRGVHYDIVHRSDAFGYGPASSFGLVWYAAGALPVAASAFTINYSYNAVPANAQALTESQWRLLGTDVVYHAGITTAYRFHFAVVYARNHDTTVVNTDIDAALARLIGPLGFDSALQVSDVLQAVHNVDGVDNVRFLNVGDDAAHYAIEAMSTTGVSMGVPYATGGRAVDLYFDDAHVPVFHSTRIITKTRSSFGAA